MARVSDRQSNFIKRTEFQNSTILKRVEREREREREREAKG